MAADPNPPVSTLRDVIDAQWKGLESCHVVGQLHCYNKLMRAVAKRLDDLGFRRFSFVAEGSNAIVLATTDNQLIRLSEVSLNERLERPKHPAILEPLFREVLPLKTWFEDYEKNHQIILEVFPKVNMCYSHRDKLARALRQSGLEPRDLDHTGNTGEIEFDGKTIPLLLDAGCVTIDYEYTKDEHQKLRKSLSPWLDKDGEWLQRKWLAQQRKLAGYEGNEKGIIGVVPRAQVNELETLLRGPKSENKKERRKSQTTEAISKDGMYQRELSELYERAYERIDPDRPQNFSQLLKEERAKMKTEHETKR